MATYVIGDVQGCFDELQLLLSKINFDKNKDKLIFAGDIINKGPKSIETINFIMGLGDSAEVVLGNHEISFLSMSYNYLPVSTKNSSKELLKAENIKEIRDWLSNQKLLAKHGDYIITHAGIPHIWSPKKAQTRATEVEFVLRCETTRKLLLSNIFNNEITCKWDKELEGIDRWLCILNYFTRMRTISKKGRLNLKFSSTLENAPEGYKAWFDQKNKKLKPKQKIIFGHWAAIKGNTNNNQFIALDTGCVFGGDLTCYCIETQKRHSVKSIQKYRNV